MSQDIYCDEAGFTGNNLLDPEQPYFAVGSVAIAADEAAELVQQVTRDYRIEGPELKAQRLIRYARGRKAISAILEAINDRALVAVWHKRYALATKFFEHVFEPVLAERNSIFYDIGFHRFISNVIYFEALAGGNAQHTLEQFQRTVRSKDSARLPALFPRTGIGDEEVNVLNHIETFVLCHQDTITREIESFSNSDPVFSWVLDASFSALIALLAEWGERHESLRVIIDESKPLYDQRGVFDVMIGRTDQVYVAFEDKRRSITFNLVEPVHFVESHEYPGVQLADIVVAIGTYVFRNPRADRSQSWLRLLKPCLSEFCVFPDADRMDLRSEQGFVNALILYELVQRTLKDKDLFDGMPRFIAAAQQTFQHKLREGEL